MIPDNLGPEELAVELREAHRLVVRAVGYRDKRSVCARALRGHGWTLQRIADECGVTRHAVEQWIVRKADG